MVTIKDYNRKWLRMKYHKGLGHTLWVSAKSMLPSHISGYADKAGESDGHTHFLHLVFQPYISATYGWSERVILRNCVSSISPL